MEGAIYGQIYPCVGVWEGTFHIFKYGTFHIILFIVV